MTTEEQFEAWLASSERPDAWLCRELAALEREERVRCGDCDPRGACTCVNSERGE